MSELPTGQPHVATGTATPPAPLASDSPRGDGETFPGGESLWRALTHRFVRVGKLPRVVRGLFIATLAQLVVVGALLATQYLPQPMVVDGISGGHLTEVPLAVFVVVLVSGVVAWTFALAGVARFPLLPRLCVLVALTAVLGFVPIEEARILTGVTLQPYAAEVPLRWAQLAVIALMWAWVLFAPALLKLGRAPDDDAHARVHWRSLLGALVLVVLYYALDVRITNLYASAGLAQARFEISGSDQVAVLGIVLAVVTYWASTDFIDMGQRAMSGLVHLSARLRPPLNGVAWAGLTVVAAALVLADVLRRFTVADLVPSLVLTLVLAALVVLLVRLARVDGAWPTEAPVLAPIAGATLVFLYLQGTGVLSGVIADLLGRDPNATYPLVEMANMVVAVLGLLCGLACLARARVTTDGVRQRLLAAVGLFLALVALLLIGTAVPGVATALGVHLSVTLQPNLASLKLLAGGAALVAVGWFLARGRRARDARWMVGALLLLAGLQVATWIVNNLNPALDAASAASAVVAGVLFLIAFAWDLFTAGDSGLNADTPGYPREGSALLYLGYTLLASTTLLYVSTERFMATGEAVGIGASSSDLTLAGVIALGVPFLVYAAILAVGRGAPVVEASPVVPPSRRAVTLPLGLAFAAGALVVLAVIVLTVGSVLPGMPIARATQPAAQPSSTAGPAYAPYAAAAPGPAPCDTGGALWQVSSMSLTCAGHGTQFSLPGKSQGVLAFTPPQDAFPPNYRVSLVVDFSQATYGCIEIGLRASETGSYEYAFCGDGEYWIQRFPNSGNDVVTLRQGQDATLAGTRVTMEASISGSTLTLNANGTPLIQVSDTTYPQTGAALLINAVTPTTHPATFTLSNFAYQPLP